MSVKWLSLVHRKHRGGPKRFPRWPPCKITEHERSQLFFAVPFHRHSIIIILYGLLFALSLLCNYNQLHTFLLYFSIMSSGSSRPDPPPHTNTHSRYRCDWRRWTVLLLLLLLAGERPMLNRITSAYNQCVFVIWYEFAIWWKAVVNRKTFLCDAKIDRKFKYLHRIVCPFNLNNRSQRWVSGTT